MHLFWQMIINQQFLVLQITKVEGEVHEFACTQLHHTMMGRDRIVKETTFDALKKILLLVMNK